MVRCSKLQLLVSVLLVTAVFLTMQLFLMNLVKNFASNNSSFDKQKAELYSSSRSSGKVSIERRFNPRFNFRAANFSTPQIPSTSTTAPSINQANEIRTVHKTNRIEMDIPLDDKNQAPLLYQLPFYLKKQNYFSFTFSNVTLVQKHFAKNDNKMKEFLDIELENRQIDRNRFEENQNLNAELKDDAFFKSIRGINKVKYELYRPDANGLFKCLYSNQKISYSNLNDDFCDCVDGSDEPGTSACQFSVFYCSMQDEILVNNFISSSKVDDKRCDCCDGSDELYVKCPNRCDEAIRISKASMSNIKRGLIAKQQYLDAGRAQSEKEYGPSGVFYLLSEKCFKIERAEYYFEVCPFKKATQGKKDNHSYKMLIGSKSTLRQANKLKWILKMEHGDATNCASPRKTEIRFECGAEDNLVSVDEPQPCLYVFHLLTPAAC